MSATLPPAENEPPRRDLFAEIDIRADRITGGSITGISAKTAYINGDVVTVIHGKGSAPPPTRETPPYKFLAPYTFDDEPLFKGREAHVTRLLKTMAGQQVVVLWGKAGVGKTSLVNAGIRPKFAAVDELRMVYLNTYHNPLEAIRKGLAASEVAANGNGSGARAAGPGLRAMARAVYEKTKLPLVLLLDQFELLFRNSTTAETRSGFISELVETLDKAPAEEFSLLIVVDESDINHVLVLQSPAREHQLQAAHVMLPPLTRAEARQAILGPLATVGTPDLLEEGFVDGTLLPDLVNMGDGDFSARDAAGAGNRDECVYPPYLQIVCHSLYMLARGLPGNRVTPAAYKAELGAEGIFARHLENSLALHFDAEEDRECAKRVLLKMTEPGFKGWGPAEKLGVECGPRPGGLDVFETLADAGLLSARTVEGRREYTLPNPAVLKAARNLLGAEAQKFYLALDEVEQLYASWLQLNDDAGTLASVEQLKFLERFAPSMRLDPVRALVLLRSAVARHEPTRPWLEKLRQSAGGPALIKKLEDAESRRDDPPSSVLTNAKLLLGMTRRTGPDEPEAEGRFETVAHAAVFHESRAVRETAVVGLMALGNSYAVGQVDAVLGSLAAKGEKIRLRRVELRAAMLEADPGMKQQSAVLTRNERRMIFLWVLLRKAYQDRVRLLRLMAGGALGTGLALGLLRAVLDKTVGVPANLGFNLKLFYGCIFGGIISFGLAMLKPWRLASKVDGDSVDEVAAVAPSSPYKAAFITCTVLFGIVHMLVHLMDGRLDVPLRLRLMLLGMGFVGGLGISWAVAGDLAEDGTIKTRWNTKYVGGAALIFLLAQIVFILTAASRNTTMSLLLVNSGRKYAWDFRQSIRTAIDVSVYGAEAAMEMRVNYIVPPVYHYFAAIDSTLTGLMFAVGIKLGLSVADKYVPAPNASAQR